MAAKTNVNKKKKKVVVKSTAELYNTLTSIQFDVKGKVYEIDVGSELIIEGEDVHSQVERIPAVMGYFGAVVALLKKEFKDKEVLAKHIEAKIDRKVREAGVSGEQRIDKAIKRHPKWLESQLEVNKARENHVRSQYLYNSLKEKSMVLLSRSADIRSTPSDSIMGISRDEIFPSKDDDNDNDE